MTRRPLDTGDFSGFFRAVHGVEPFPWQQRLLEQVVASGWPDVLDLPTGSGKTAVIDVAVFHLALEAALLPGERRAPVRIVYVVDRRLIADQAYERAFGLAAALYAPDPPDVIARVGTALRGRGDPPLDVPLTVTVLRGGVWRDEGWARTPNQPLIVCSTVDQVGSRLLFRGYGLSESARPIHAGLLGNDALLLLDEVHLSRSFEQTLESLTEYQEWGETRLPRRWAFVRLSATPGVIEKRARVLRLDPKDKSHPVLEPRIAAHKKTRLLAVAVRGDGEKRRERFADQCAAEALGLAKGGARTVGVVVNRVDTARRVAERLRNLSAGDVALLTGRMRPIDRDATYEAIRPRVASDPGRSTPPASPFFLVATQCIEAGADFDFDGLVTECASLDALRQRFGRLDRLGCAGESSAVILAREDQLDQADPDPVYGTALAATWEWLRQQGAPVDFGIAHFPMPPSEQLVRLLAPAEEAPVLLPAHLDAWVQTCPAPVPDPDLSLWLHGPRSGPPEVQVVWRADLDETLLARASRGDPAALGRLVERLTVCPPGSAEALPLPIHAAKAWLGQGIVGEVADVEVTGSIGSASGAGAGGRPAVQWRGDDSDVVFSPDVRPGTTLVVPVTYGGITAKDRCWDPSATTAVVDMADLVHLAQRRRAVLRLHKSVLAGYGLPSPPVIDGDADLSEARAAVRGWLDAIEAPPTAPSGLARLLSLLRTGRPPWRLMRVGDGDGAYYVVGGRARIPPAGLAADFVAASETSDFTTEPDTSPFTAREIALGEHCRGVEEYARRFARDVGLSDDLAGDIALAAWLHDVGKADPRFQAMLRGGSEVAVAMGDRLLAKSATHLQDRAAQVLAQRLSGYPRGMRHEMLSVALTQDVGSLRERAHDWSLVMHLIASHHGHGRPLAPAVPDPSPVTVILEHDGVALSGSSDHALARLDSMVAGRFWQLVRRYGWHGLAWLETILRLADHRRSEAEATGEIR